MFVCIYKHFIKLTNLLLSIYLSLIHFVSHLTSHSHRVNTKKNNAKKCSRFSRNKFPGAFKTDNNVAGEVWDVGSGEDWQIIARGCSQDRPMLRVVSNKQLIVWGRTTRNNLALITFISSKSYISSISSWRVILNWYQSSFNIALISWI